MRLGNSLARKKNFENGHTKKKLLRFEVENAIYGHDGQGTIELE